jgi:ubiquinone/menaquinone biosynthesis C-methylase UbiE
MLKNESHIEVLFSIENLDNYYIRTSIFNALKSCLPFFKGKLLDVGCGKMPYKEYILKHSKVENYAGLDISTAIEYDKEVKPDYTWDGNTIPFENETYDTVMATEVLEHCPMPAQTLNEMYRVLRKDGYLFLTVPFLWTLHEIPHDEYRYTPFALQRLLKETGFANIEIKATGGWHASLAQMLGLWVRRSGLTKRKKKYLSKLLKPIIYYLMKKDRLPTHFSEGLMITGLFVLAKK